MTHIMFGNFSIEACYVEIGGTPDCNFLTMLHSKIVRSNTVCMSGNGDLHVN